MGQTGGVAARDVTGREPREDGTRAEGRATPATVLAPAKLTVSLRIVGVRPDGFHLIEAEMVTVDLFDELSFEAGSSLRVLDEVVGGLGTGDVDAGPGNLVCRALRAAGTTAAVTLRKRIPTRAGLGGGSADAAAVLRWAGAVDPELAVRLGADVPFCVIGGRAAVSGIGEVVRPLPPRPAAYVLLVPPIGVETAACYRAWDELGAAPRTAAHDTSPAGPVNDLEPAALAVLPEMGAWRDALAGATNRRPMLAGSGSTWFVEGTPEELGLQGRSWLEVGGRRAPLVPVRTLGSEGAGRADASATSAGTP